ncbi:MAG: hypothetical protein M1831_007235 [Alyxoria varia]|nr:MAG: hypothetical protein M1831_007235 [Alyxoria varia]
MSLRLSFPLLALASSLLLTTLALAQDAAPAIPANQSDFDPKILDQNTRVLLVISGPRSPGDEPPVLNPLSRQALTELPSGQGSTDGRGTDIFLLNAYSSKNISHASSNIAFASCDDDDYPGEISLNDVTQDAVNENVSAVIFASKREPFCNLTDAAPNGYTAYYSMTDLDNSNTLMNELGGVMSDHMGMASIMTQVAYRDAMSKSADDGFGGPSPSTAVAMIILYSITGVITALFLVIIITGAIRAHRHPERYRPRVLGGQGRPSRAKGLARAMLDSIPIVKFGDNQQHKEPGEGEGDVEMAEGSSDSNRRRSGDQQSQTGSGAREHREEESEGSPRAARTSADGSVEEPTTVATAATSSAQPSKRNSKAPGAGAGSNAEEGLGCSICTEDFVKGEDIRVLPCDHKFHPACVDPWLLDVSGTCPLCRVDLRPAKSNETANGEDQTHDYLDTNTFAEPRRRSTLLSNANNNALGAIGGGGNREGAPLPPPLDGDNGAAGSSTGGPLNTRHRRRDTIVGFFDPWRLPRMTREQRVAVLRDYRQEQRRSGENDTTARNGEADGEEGSSSAAQQMSGGSGPGGSTTATAATTAGGVNSNEERSTVDAHARRNKWSRVRRTIFMGAARDRRSTATTASAGATANNTATVNGNANRNASLSANVNTDANTSASGDAGGAGEVNPSSGAEPSQTEGPRELDGDQQHPVEAAENSQQQSKQPSRRPSESKEETSGSSPQQRVEEEEGESLSDPKKKEQASSSQEKQENEGESREKKDGEGKEQPSP